MFNHGSSGLSGSVFGGLKRWGALSVHGDDLLCEVVQVGVGSSEGAFFGAGFFHGIGVLLEQGERDSACFVCCVHDCPFFLLTP
jgi:hypothetical protein